MRDIKTIIAISAILLSLILIVGCSQLNTPTAPQASTHEGLGMWNPGHNDHVIPGDEIPLLNAGYWESHEGWEVNTPDNGPVSAVIGPEGGQLRLGLHRLVIPRGAVSAPITFTMTYASMTAVAVDCGPSPFSFNIPVTLYLSYAGTQFDNPNRGGTPSLGVYYLPPQGNPEVMPSSVDVNGRVVVAQVSHFSRYIISGIVR